MRGNLGEGGFDELAWVKAGFHRMPFWGGLSPNVRGGSPLFYGTFGETPPPWAFSENPPLRAFGENPLGWRFTESTIKQWENHL